jgi:hypothetical protein
MPTQALELVQAGYPVRADRLAPILVDLVMRDVDVPAIRDGVPLEMMKKTHRLRARRLPTCTSSRWMR